MPNPTFPIFGSRAALDSSTYSIQYENVTMRSPTDGGYVITRKRHTRTPRVTFTVTYRNMTTPDKAALNTFFNSVNCSVIFDWPNLQDGQVYAVRFKEPIRLDYKGHGTNAAWDCSMILEQA